MVTRNSISTVAGFVARLIEEFAPEATPDLAAMTETTRELIVSKAITGFIASNKDGPIGVLMLNECAAIYAGGRFGEITELYVRPEFRSMGVAAALVARAVDEGKKRGWKRLEVGAPEQPRWARTLTFYRRAGFADVGPRLRMLL